MIHLKVIQSTCHDTPEGDRAPVIIHLKVIESTCYDTPEGDTEHLL